MKNILAIVLLFTLFIIYENNFELKEIRINGNLNNNNVHQVDSRPNVISMLLLASGLMIIGLSSKKVKK